MPIPNIIIITAHFHPGYKMGGPLVSITNIISQLSGDCSFKVLTSDRDLGDIAPYPKINSTHWTTWHNTPVRYLKRDVWFPFRLIWTLRQTSNTDTVVYLNSLFDPRCSIAVVVACFLGLIPLKFLLISPRGELYDEALGFKPEKKRLFLRLAHRLNLYKNVHWHATTPEEKAQIVQQMQVPDSHVKVASLIPIFDDLLPPVFIPEVSPLKIVYLSRIAKDKNTDYIFDVLQMVKVPVILDVYGPIEDSKLWIECLKKAQKLPPNVTFAYKGGVAKVQVYSVLTQYDLFFLPTFAENFGHAIAEALLSGTPVLISDNTPWRDLESRGWGADISLTDPSKFAAMITSLAGVDATTRYQQRIQRQQAVLLELSRPQTVADNLQLFR